MSAKQLALSHPKYRPDIDGLRAIAVLAVVVFHAFPNCMRGGFIGVDVFFVISGYLISTIIFSNLERDSFSLGEFYIRRIKRIFPALTLVLVTCFTFGWFSLLPDEFKQLGKHIAAGAGFVSNFVLWSEAGYFDNSTETKPLLHLWSLGIEEQFYIVWPLLLCMAWKRKLNILVMTCFFAAASFLLNVNGVKHDSVATFFSPLTRVWELLFGSLFAWISLSHSVSANNIKNKIYPNATFCLLSAKVKSNKKFFAELFSIIGTALLVFGFWRINKDLKFPGYWALIPVFGAILIIAGGGCAWVNKNIFSNRCLVWFGLISFPLYLWHWPLLSFARIIEREEPSVGIRSSAILISILLAWLTYRFVERPVRFRNHGRLQVAILVFLMFVVGSLGFKAYEYNGFETRVSSGFTKISNAVGEWHYPGKLVQFQFEGRRFYEQRSSRSEITLFVGDSNVEQYYVRADELIVTSSGSVNSIVFTTGGGCLAIPQTNYDLQHNDCNNLMETAFDFAKSQPDVKNVVISSLWNQYLFHGEGLVGKFGVGEVDYYRSLDRFGKYIKQLREIGKNVFVILSIPTGVELDPKYMAMRGFKYFPDFFLLRDGGVSRDLLSSKYGNVQADLKAISESNGAVVITPIEFLCNRSLCPSVDSLGDPIYKDNGHLRPTYVRKSATFIDSVLNSP